MWPAAWLSFLPLASMAASIEGQVGDWRMPMLAALMEMVWGEKDSRALNVRTGLYFSEIVSWNFV
jgi:hypothetical protein